MKNVLIACEESQRVCLAFRRRGFNAFSCDILPCSGGAPEYHIQHDVLSIIYGNGYFFTQDYILHKVDKWDLIIAHPPCTYLTNTGNRWFDVNRYGNKALERHKKRVEAILFFMNIANFDKCDKIAIENPIGIISTKYKKPTQIIHPYHFGDPERKATCLWLKNLPCLQPTNVVQPNIIKYKNGRGTDSPWHMETMKLKPKERSIERSKTFPGIAEAMAEQWGNFLLKEVLQNDCAP